VHHPLFVFYVNGADYILLNVKMTDKLETIVKGLIMAWLKYVPVIWLEELRRSMMIKLRFIPSISQIQVKYVTSSPAHLA